MITDIWFLSCVLSDVHLEMRELQVTLGAAWIEADKWLSLLLCLGVHLRLSGDHMTWLVSDLWDDEGWMGRHCHVDWGSTFVHVSIGWDASCSVGNDLERKSHMLLLALYLLLLLHLVGIREGKDGISWSTGHHHVLGHRWHRVMLKWYSGAGGDSNVGHGSSNWCGKLRELGMLVWLVSGSIYHVFWSRLRLHTECSLLWLLRGVGWRVMGTQLVIGHRGTRVHRVVGGRREFLMLEVTHFWHADEVGTSIIHESRVW